MTKAVSTSKKPRKQHTPEFRVEALKLAECIGVAAPLRIPALCLAQQTAESALLVRKRAGNVHEIARLKHRLAERDEELANLRRQGMRGLKPETV